MSLRTCSRTRTACQHLGNCIERGFHSNYSHRFHERPHLLSSQRPAETSHPCHAGSIARDCCAGPCILGRGRSKVGRSLSLPTMRRSRRGWRRPAPPLLRSARLSSASSTNSTISCLRGCSPRRPWLEDCRPHTHYCTYGSQRVNGRPTRRVSAHHLGFTGHEFPRARTRATACGDCPEPPAVRWSCGTSAPASSWIGIRIPRPRRNGWSRASSVPRPSGRGVCSKSSGGRISELAVLVPSWAGTLDSHLVEPHRATPPRSAGLPRGTTRR